MKKLIAFFFLTIGFLTSNAQTFSDCATEYRAQYNKIQRQQMFKEIDKNAADSLIFQIDSKLEKCIIGNEIPDFDLVGISNTHYTKESLNGKVVVFHFWSVGCGHCVLEIPALNRLYRSYKDNENFVFISALRDSPEDYKKFLERGVSRDRIQFEVIPNGKVVMRDNFKIVNVYPTNMVISKEGKIAAIITGTLPASEPDVKSRLKSAIDAELNK